MNRRAFFGAAALVPLAIPAAASGAVFKKGGKRISTVPGDPGERLYGECCGDGRRISVYLDGIEQPMAETADEAEGFVTRVVVTENGSIAVNRVTNGIVRETVYGDVRIEISDAIGGGRRINYKSGHSWATM